MLGALPLGVAVLNFTSEEWLRAKDKGTQRGVRKLCGFSPGTRLGKYMGWVREAGAKHKFRSCLASALVLSLLRTQLLLRDAVKLTSWNPRADSSVLFRACQTPALYVCDALGSVYWGKTISSEFGTW